MNDHWIQNGHLPPAQRPWFVYMVRCADGSYYTGITQDLFRRLKQHNGLRPGGAKYTASRRPVVKVFCIQCSNKSSALKREYRLKQLSHKDKQRYDSDRYARRHPCSSRAVPERVPSAGQPSM